MKDKVTTRFYFLLRWFRDGKPDKYTSNRFYNFNHRQGWTSTSTRADAFQFPNRSEARQRVGLRCFEDLLNGRQSMSGSCPRMPETAYYWEIVKVTETVVTSFSEEIIVSDPRTPAMLVLARVS